jgi:hypothetical protein
MIIADSTAGQKDTSRLSRRQVCLGSSVGSDSTDQPPTGLSRSDDDLLAARRLS